MALDSVVTIVKGFNYDTPRPPLALSKTIDCSDTLVVLLSNNNNNNNNNSSLQKKKKKSDHLKQMNKWMDTVMNQHDIQLSKVEDLQSNIINNQQILQAEFQADIYKQERALT